jgi:NADH dehydrogenase
MSVTPSLHFDIAIIGGGFAGVYCAQQVLKNLKSEGLRVGIIASENHMVFQPMLPEVVGGSLSPRHVVNPIRTICEDADVLKGSVIHLDLEKRSLILDGGKFTSNVQVTFDHLMLAPGAGVDLSRIPGMSEHSYLMRTVGDAMKLRAAIISRMEEANLLTRSEDRKAMLSFVVVGGGYSGVETAGQMQDLIAGVLRYYDNIMADEPSVTLIHSGDQLLSMLGTRLGDYTRSCLEKMGVNLILNQRVRAVTAQTVQLNDGRVIGARLVVCTVGNAPHPLLTTLGSQGVLPLERGKVIVEATGQVKGLEKVWAAGDCAAFPKVDGGLCPETAQFAMRQGTLIGNNITASIRKKPLKPFKFTGLGELATIGHRKAVAMILGLRFSGLIAWFMWRSVYLMKLPGFDRKLRVMTEWTFELFFPRDINLLTPSFSSPLGEMHLEAGDSLFRTGEPAQSLYAVKQGCIEITDAHGNLVKAARAGEHFGERALLGDGIWRFDAKAKEPTELVAIDGDTFKTLVTSIGSLDTLFRQTAQQYHLPEEIQKTVAEIPEPTRLSVAADMMTTDVASLKADQNVQDALLEFQARPHSTYPITDSHGKVVGQLRRSVAYDWLRNHGFTSRSLLKELPLTVPFCVPASTPVPDLVQTLMRTGRSKAIVVDVENRLLGIVTVFDLVKGSPAEA